MRRATVSSTSSRRSRSSTETPPGVITYKSRIGLSSLTLEDVINDEESTSSSSSEEEQFAMQSTATKGDTVAQTDIKQATSGPQVSVRRDDKNVSTQTAGITAIPVQAAFTKAQEASPASRKSRITRSVSFSLQSETRSYSIEAPSNVLGDAVIEDTKTKTPPSQPKPATQLVETFTGLPSVAETIREDDQAFSFLDAIDAKHEIPLMELGGEANTENSRDAPMLESMGEQILNISLVVPRRPLREIMREVAGWIPGLRIGDESSISNSDSDQPIRHNASNVQRKAMDGPEGDGRPLEFQGYATEVVESDAPDAHGGAISDTEIEESEVDTSLEPEQQARNASLEPEGTIGGGYETERVLSSTDEDVESVEKGNEQEHASSASRILLKRSPTTAPTPGSHDEGESGRTRHEEPSSIAPPISSRASVEFFNNVNVACEMLRLAKSELPIRDLMDSVQGVLGILFLDFSRYYEPTIRAVAWSPDIDENTHMAAFEDLQSPVTFADCNKVKSLEDSEVEANNDVQPVLASAESISGPAMDSNDANMYVSFDIGESDWQSRPIDDGQNEAATLADGVVPEEVGFHPEPVPIEEPQDAQTLLRSDISSNPPELILRADTFEAPPSMLMSQPLDLSSYIHICTFSPSERPRARASRAVSKKAHTRSTGKKRRYPLHSLGHVDAKRIFFG